MPSGLRDAAPRDRFGEPYELDVALLPEGALVPAYRAGSVHDFTRMEFRTLTLPHDWDPDGHTRADGRWHETVGLPHEPVRFEPLGGRLVDLGCRVPAYDLRAIDPERADWQRRRDLESARSGMRRAGWTWHDVPREE